MDIPLLIVATILGGLLAEALYLISVNTGLFVANDPCGTYLRPNSCLMINPSYQLIFLLSGGTIGCLLYFVNVMHMSKFAFLMELNLGLDGVILGAMWIILPKYDPWFGETAYFAAMFIVSVLIAQTAFLFIDRLRTRNALNMPENSGVASPTSKM